VRGMGSGGCPSPGYRGNLRVALTPHHATLLVVGMEALPERRATLMLNTIRHRQYHELCELLGGRRHDDWVALAYGHGEPVLKSPEAWLFVEGAPVDATGENPYHYALVRRAHFDLDYKNYVLAQVWDHNDDRPPSWEFVLFFNTGENQWVPEQVYSWGQHCPSYAQAGAIVDAVEELRRQAW
jgi:hypothetical protein